MTFFDAPSGSRVNHKAKDGGGDNKQSMAASSAAAPSKLTQNFDRAREEYARAQEIMVERAMELERMQKELNAAQREVLDRERKLMEAAVKDGLTATTATAAMVALNPATAAKVRPLPVFVGPTLSRCSRVRGSEWRG